MSKQDKHYNKTMDALQLELAGLKDRKSVV